MLDKKVLELSNDRINKELYSIYLYPGSSFYYQEQGLNGFANWYMIQTQEEHDHVMLLLQYSQNNGEHVILKQVDKPDKVRSVLKDPLEFALERGHYVTNLTHIIYNAAHEMKDYRTMRFLDRFIKEQGEEKKNIEGMVKKFELFGTDLKSLYMLDNEMVGRVHSAPSLVL